MLHYPARIELGHLPTPVEEMPRLTKALAGPRLFIKRDDETGQPLPGLGSVAMEDQVSQQRLGFESGGLGQWLVIIADV